MVISASVRSGLEEEGKVSDLSNRLKESLLWWEE